MTIPRASADWGVTAQTAAPYNQWVVHSATPDEENTVVLTGSRATTRWFVCVSWLFLLATFSAASAAQKAPAPRAPKATTQPAKATTQPAMPCPATRSGEDVPRFVTGSPFSTGYKKPTEKRERVLWAKSCLWQEAPKFVVEKWLTNKPETKGKYVLIEFWATWCPPCRKSIGLLNEFHKKYGKDLIVIGVSDETEAAVRKLKTPKIEYYSAIDTKGRMKKELDVRGIPHAIILEPSERIVIWEGFPYLKGYELTEKIIKKIVSIKPAEPKAKKAKKADRKKQK